MHNPLKTHETGNDRLKEALFLHETRNLILLRQNKTLQQSFVHLQNACPEKFFLKDLVRFLELHLKILK